MISDNKLWFMLIHVRIIRIPNWEQTSIKQEAPCKHKFRVDLLKKSTNDFAPPGSHST